MKSQLLNKIWTGQPLKCDGAISFDTETTLVAANQIPELIVLTCSNNVDTFIVPPNAISDWVRAIYETGCNLVAHNVAFDFHVVHQALTQMEDRILWQSMLDSNRFHDTMILDFLIRLAQGEEEGPLRPKSLADLCEHYLNIKLDKTAQTEWAQFAKVALELVPESFLQYAIKDSQVTRELYNELHPAAVSIAKRHSVLHPEYGPLTHHIQVRGAVALADCTTTGIKINQSEQKTVGNEITAQIQGRVDYLLEKYPQIFKKDVVKKRLGQLILNPKTGVPQIDNKSLRGLLLEIATELKINKKHIPTTEKSNEITISADFWERHRAHPFLGAWLDLSEKVKLLNFVLQISTDQINPKYQALVRTGRTSCSSPNLQQMPRAAWFRKLFVPSPGCKFVIADYAAIELRCLAAVCKARFGVSGLAHAFEEGIDPHCYTASMLADMEYEKFMALKKTDKARFDRWRQSAKAINFGVPGGLGAKSLSEYAQLQYGVSMTVPEARMWKQKLITEIYPELELYLQSDLLENMAINMQVPMTDIVQVLEISRENIDVLWGMQQVIAGRKQDSKGKSYSSTFRRWVWACLIELNNDPTLELALRSRRGSENLKRRVFGKTVITLTGRVRGSAEFTESCNTQFQGLAADGAKLALYEVCKLYPVVAFVHDEIVAEVPGDQPEIHKEVIQRTMVREMDRVLFGYCNSEVEAIVSDYWSKS